MEHLAIVVRIIEDAIANLFAIDLVNAKRLPFLDLKRSAICGRNYELFCKGTGQDQDYRSLCVQS